MNFIPSKLNEEKFTELSAKDGRLCNLYTLQDNGFYTLNSGIDRESTKQIFKELGFSALNFTDSRGIFQYYNLKYLYKNIQTAMGNGVKVMNIATEPVTIAEIYNAITGKEFVNELGGAVPHYDFKTENFEIFGGKDGYIQTKEFVLNDIKEYIAEMTK